MKKIIVLSSTLLLTLGLNVAMADVATSDSTAVTSTPSTAMPTTSGAMTGSETKKMKKTRPCMSIATACEDAGYRLSKTTPGKNIWRDCVKPVVSGQSISGVTVSANDVQACKTNMDKWKSKHMSKQQQVSAKTY